MFYVSGTYCPCQLVDFQCLESLVSRSSKAFSGDSRHRKNRNAFHPKAFFTRRWFGGCTGGSRDQGCCPTTGQINTQLRQQQCCPTVMLNKTIIDNVSSFKTCCA